MLAALLMPCRWQGPKDGPLGAMMAAILKSVAFPLSPFVGIPSRERNNTLIRPCYVSFYPQVVLFRLSRVLFYDLLNRRRPPLPPARGEKYRKSPPSLAERHINLRWLNSFLSTLFLHPDVSWQLQSCHDDSQRRESFRRDEKSLLRYFSK